ncbi:hypothetical protein GCM10023328_32960 [Modestobacter marinus]|uniref:Secreted protein n=1 Tax=Modestobacter marinus TaxID=477641 RepID=A0A846LK24_9ACTN|nr:DUF2550 domain-containing protein [Modestobacter marinus]NIH67877.1 hypothetical protein [Modestobacter marinus]GGL70590.1 hypothetical protein GCM10011589_28620 [Modestobacter marinus]
MTTAVLVLVGLLLVALVAAFLLRRRFLLSGLGAVTMWLRAPGTSRWAVGVAWYSGDMLLWYRALSLSVRPNRRLCRAQFQVDARRRPTAADLSLPDESVILTVRTGSGPQELAMDSSTVTGFLSWIESAPPVDR